MRAAFVALVLMALLPAATGTEGGFGAPVKLNAPGTYGYEPTIDVAPDGRLFVTAHRGSVANEGASFASFVWRSDDGGASWSEIEGPMRNALYAFEGDLDLDATGRVYFADTFGPDLWLSSSADGAAWDQTTPLATAATFNDRPWLAAQGDGILHLTTQEATGRPAVGDLLAAGGPSPSSSVFYYRSEDGGLTWTLGHALPGALFCHVAGSPVDADDIAILCATGTALAPREVVHRSRDAGRTWTSEEIFQHAGPSAATSFVSIAFDDAGTVYAAFIDGAAGGDRLHLAKNVGGGWSVEDITPFRGTIRKAWTTAAGNGRVAVAFYATSDAPAVATSAWHVHAISTDGASARSPAWAHELVDPVPVTRRAVPPQDFLQAALAPEGALFVAYARDAPIDAAHTPPPDFDADILVASRPS